MDRHQIEAIHESAAGHRLAQRQPLPGSVYEIVTDMLMTHVFEPGAKLNIEELARTLDVSPTPVREALARVEADGLIVNKMHAARGGLGRECQFLDRAPYGPAHVLDGPVQIVVRRVPVRKRAQRIDDGRAGPQLA